MGFHVPMVPTIQGSMYRLVSETIHGPEKDDTRHPIIKSDDTRG